MPGKFEIMRAVQDGLNSLRVDKSWTDVDWTPAVKTKLCKIGQDRFGCKVGERNGLEWPATALIEAPLVAECEWGRGKNLEYIVEDFEKLLLARADVRLMIFDGNHKPGSKEIAERLAGKVREFNGSRAEDAWLLAAWEGSNDDWRFRYFTIEMNAAIPFLPPSRG